LFYHFEFDCQGECGFFEPWAFVVAFKDNQARMSWLEDEAIYNLKMQKRGMQTIDGSTPFRHFDGAVINSYKYPTKSWETVFCRRETVADPACSLGGRGFHTLEEFGEETDVELKCLAAPVDDASSEQGFFSYSRHDSLLAYDSLLYSPFIGYSTKELLNWEFDRALPGRSGRRRGGILELFEEECLTEPFLVHHHLANETARQSPQVYNPLHDRQIHFHHGVLLHK
jgi:hypothetical protein